MQKLYYCRYQYILEKLEQAPSGDMEVSEAGCYSVSTILVWTALGNIRILYWIFWKLEQN